MKAYIDFHPGQELDEEFRAFQGCPTISITKGGRMFAGWYTGGLLEPCLDNVNVLVQSDDGGESWSKPILAVHTDTEKKNRNIDIQTWVDAQNRLWVMWTLSPYYEGSVPATIRTPFVCNYHREFIGVEMMMCKDPDAKELVWEEPRILSFGFDRCKPVITSKGRYILPAYDWVHAENYMLRLSDDQGKTFYDVVAAKKPDNQVYDETMVYEADGKLHLLARTNRGYYAHAESEDDGLHWGETTEYCKAPSTRMFIGRLSSGELAFVRSVADDSRTGMKIMLSEDEGKTWPYELVLDSRENVSYPDLAEDGQGHIFVIYDRERDNRAKLDKETWTSEAAKEILLSKLTTADIKEGRLCRESYTARVISKGRMNKVEK